MRKLLFLTIICSKCYAIVPNAYDTNDTTTIDARVISLTGSNTNTINNVVTNAAGTGGLSSIVFQPADSDLTNLANRIIVNIGLLSGSNGVVQIVHADGTFTNFFGTDNTTRGNALKAAIATHVNNDTIYLGQGMFDVGDVSSTGMGLKTNVAVIGQGQNLTYVKGLNDPNALFIVSKTNYLSGLSLIPVDGFAIISIVPFGTVFLNDIGGTAQGDFFFWKNPGTVVGNNIRIISDGTVPAGDMWLQNNGTNYLYNSYIEQRDNGYASTAVKATAGSKLVIYNSTIVGTALSNNLISAGSAAIEIHSSSIIEAGNSNLVVTGTGTISVDSATSYDATKTLGTIALLNSYGNTNLTFLSTGNGANLTNVQVSSLASGSGTSAQLAASLTDENGSGAAFFGSNGSSLTNLNVTILNPSGVTMGQWIIYTNALGSLETSNTVTGVRFLQRTNGQFLIPTIPATGFVSVGDATNNGVKFFGNGDVTLVSLGIPVAGVTNGTFWATNFTAQNGITNTGNYTGTGTMTNTGALGVSGNGIFGGTLIAASRITVDSARFNSTGTGWRATSSSGTYNTGYLDVYSNVCNFATVTNTIIASNFMASSSAGFDGDGSGLTNLAGTFGLVNSNFLACSTQTNICIYTVPSGVTNTYQVGGYINVTAVTTDVIIGKVIFTDENNTSQTVSLMGSGISTVSFNSIASQQIRCKGGTTITLQANLTTSIGSIAYDCGGNIEPKF